MVAITGLRLLLEVWGLAGGNINSSTAFLINSMKEVLPHLDKAIIKVHFFWVIFAVTDAAASLCLCYI